MSPVLFWIYVFSLIFSSATDPYEALLQSQVDLHSHSTYSDGSDSPLELVRKAKELNLKVLAITDHDQIKYSKAALEEAERSGIMIVPGTEISVEWTYSAPTSQGMFSKAHLLAYFTREDDSSELAIMLKNLREARDNRNQLILSKIKDLYHFEITMTEVEAQARDEEGRLQVVGRPHIAEAMVKRGYASDVSEVFAKYLNDQNLNLPKWSLDLSEAVNAVVRHRAIPVLAHPITLKITYEELDRELNYLINIQKVPLKGLECFSSRHSRDQALTYVSLAHKYNLIATGGSDYHGTLKNNVSLGIVGNVGYAWNLISISTWSKLLDSFESLQLAFRVSTGDYWNGILDIFIHLTVYLTIGLFLHQVVPLFAMSPQTGWQGTAQALMKHHPFQKFFQLLTGPESQARDKVKLAPQEDIEAQNLIPETELVITTNGHQTNGAHQKHLDVSRSSPRAAPRSSTPPGGVPEREILAEILAPHASSSRFRLGNFLYCGTGLCVIYMCWSWLQERMMTVSYDGVPYRSSEFVVFMNRIVSCIFATCSLWLEDAPRSTAPPYKYALPSVSNMLSTWCQYEALQYVSFPLQVLAKTSKILASMTMGKLLHGRNYPYSDYCLAITAFFGLVLFHLSEDHGNPGGLMGENGVFVGIFLLTTYVLSDGFTGQWQQGVLKQYQISPYQMMFGINLFSAIFSLIFLLAQGKLIECFIFGLSHPDFIFHLLLMSVCTAVGQAFIYYTIAEHGAIALSAIMTFRQLLTIVMSIISFGHVVHLGGIFGLAIVFLVAGVWMYIEYSEKRKK